MAEYSPYVNSYNGITAQFQKIKVAAVPPKFNIDFLSVVLGMKSSIFRALIRLLRKLNFIDTAGNVYVDLILKYVGSIDDRKAKQ